MSTRLRLSVSVVAAALTLNILGIIRYPGGPLEPIGAPSGVLWAQLPPPAVGAPSWTPEATVSPAEQVYLATAPIRMDWPFDAIVERIDAMWDGSAPGVVAVYARAADGHLRSALPASARFIEGGAAAGSYSPPPVDIDPRICCEPQEQIVLGIDGTRTGTFRLRGVWIDYRVGPLAFRVFVPSGDTFRLIAP